MEAQDAAEQWVAVEQIAQHLNVKAFAIRESRHSLSGGGQVPPKPCRGGQVPPKPCGGGYKWLPFRHSEAKAKERKEMPAHKIGRLWRFKITEIDEWVRRGEAAEGVDKKDKGK